jgi:hypothetical protein
VPAFWENAAIAKKTRISTAIITPTIVNRMYRRVKGKNSIPPLHRGLPSGMVHC